jgi:hypothetical protein
MAETSLRWTILRRLCISTEIQMAWQSRFGSSIDYRGFCLIKAAVVVWLVAFGGGWVHAQELKSVALPKPQPVIDVVFTHKADLIAVQQRENEDEVLLYEFPSLRMRGSLTSAPSGMVFSPCGRYAAVNAIVEKAGAVAVWDVSAKPPKKLKLLCQKKEEVDVLDDALYGFHFSADSKRIRAIARSGLFEWDWQESYLPANRWPLPPGELGCSLYSYDLVLRLRGNRFKGTAGQVARFDGKSFVGVRELNPQIWGEADTCFAADLKTVVWPDQPDQNVRFADQKRRDILVMDLEKPGCKVVDRIAGDWLDKEEKTGKLYHGPICSIIPDRSLVIVYYGLTSGIPPVEHQGFGFFPRTKEKMAEFGLDPKTQTHLYLPVPKRVAVPARVVLSPDGRWLALTEVDLPPRIWPIETLGKALLADKSVLKK